MVGSWQGALAKAYGRYVKRAQRHQGRKNPPRSCQIPLDRTGGTLSPATGPEGAGRLSYMPAPGG